MASGDEKLSAGVEAPEATLRLSPCQLLVPAAVQRPARNNEAALR